MKSYKGVTLDGEAVEVFVNGEKIDRVETIESNDALPLIAPPLVDLQNNGGLGTAFNSLNESPERIFEMAEFFRSHGTGQLLATLTTVPVEQMQQTTSNLGKLLDDNPDLAELFPGIFFEGIFMSKEYGWRGAHPEEFILDPDYDVIKDFNDRLGGRIQMVNVAPEEPGGMAFIDSAVKDGIAVAMGHCNPTAGEVGEAVKRGATYVTHFGNGAPSLIHRHKNPLWAWLVHDELKIGLIGDGHHLPKELIQAAINAKGRDKVHMVSDTSGISGMPAGVYGEDGGITLEKNGFLHLTGDELLAGAWHQLDRSVELLCEMGWSLADAWTQASIIPAKSAGLTVPEIAAGERARFVVSSFDKSSGLTIQSILHNGREITPRQVNPE